MPRITGPFVNGSLRNIDSDPATGLLTGAKYGGGEGQCGACTVLIDGVTKRSCVTPTDSAGGKSSTTIGSGSGIAGGYVATCTEVAVSDLKNQIKGMGIGGALFESADCANGLSQYRVPRCGYVPRMERVLV